MAHYACTIRSPTDTQMRALTTTTTSYLSTHQHMFVPHSVTVRISSFHFLNNGKQTVRQKTLEIQKHLQALGIRTLYPRQT